MDLPTFFLKIRSSIANVLRKETSKRSIRSQTTTWIRFTKEDEYVNLAFNSTMTPVYMLSDIDSIVQSMINHMAQQVCFSAIANLGLAIYEMLRVSKYHKS